MSITPVYLESKKLDYHYYAGLPKKETLGLSERVFECGHCGFVIDRDLNAAINLSKTVS